MWKSSKICLMSGLLLILNRDGAPADSQMLDTALGRLAHRGPDGSRAITEQSIALGHQHFWTTPELDFVQNEGHSKLD